MVSLASAGPANDTREAIIPQARKCARLELEVRTCCSVKTGTGIINASSTLRYHRANDYLLRNIYPVSPCTPYYRGRMINGLVWKIDFIVGTYTCITCTCVYVYTTHSLAGILSTSGSPALALSRLTRKEYVTFRHERPSTDYGWWIRLLLIFWWSITRDSLAVPFAPKEGIIIHPCSRRWINNLLRHTSGHQRTDFTAAAAAAAMALTPAEPFPRVLCVTDNKGMRAIRSLLGPHRRKRYACRDASVGDLPQPSMCVRWRLGARREARAVADFEWHGRFISFTRERAINAIGMVRVCCPFACLSACLPAYLRICVCVNTHRFGYARMPTDESWPRSVTIWEHDR